MLSFLYDSSDSFSCAYRLLLSHAVFPCHVVIGVAKIRVIISVIVFAAFVSVISVRLYALLGLHRIRGADAFAMSRNWDLVKQVLVCYCRGSPYISLI